MGGGSRRRGRRVTGKHAPRPALPRPRLPRRPHPRPAQSPGASLTDTHYSPEPGRRPAGSTCPARRGAASGLGVSSPRPALHPGPPPGPALRPAPRAQSPRPRPGRPGLLAAARAPGGRKGGVVRSGRHTLTARSIASKTHSPGSQANGGGGGWRRSGAINHPLPRKGLPLPGRGRWSGCRGPGCPSRRQGARCFGRDRCPVHRVALQPARWRSGFRDSGSSVFFSPTLQGRRASASSLEGLCLERWSPPEECNSPRPRCPGAKRRPWVSLAARKFCKLRADPPTWGESSGWPGAQPRDLSFHTLRRLAAPKALFLSKPSQ